MVPRDGIAAFGRGARPEFLNRNLPSDRSVENAHVRSIGGEKVFGCLERFHRIVARFCSCAESVAPIDEDHHRLSARRKAQRKGQAGMRNAPGPSRCRELRGGTQQLNRYGTFGPSDEIHRNCAWINQTEPQSAVLGRRNAARSSEP